MHVSLLPNYQHFFKLYYPVIIFKDNLLLSKMTAKCTNLEHKHRYNYSVWFSFILCYALTVRVHKYGAIKFCTVAPNSFCITITVLPLYNGKVHTVGSQDLSCFMSPFWGQILENL